MGLFQGKIKKGRGLLVALASVALLSACGGDNTVSPKGMSAGYGSCDPASGPAGTEVTCDLPKGVDDSCALFLDKSQVDVHFTDDSFTFKASGPSGEKGLSFQCGKDAVPVGTFEIPSGKGETTSEEKNGGDETIVPAGTGSDADPAFAAKTFQSAPTAAAKTLQPADSDGDGVADASDQCPGTPTGTAVDATTGCAAVQRTFQPSALTATINVTKMFDTRIGLVKVDWTVTGGDDLSDLYIYSGGFYRVAADASKTDPCGEISGDSYSSNGSRLLLVHSNGDDLNDGSSDYNQWSSYLGTAQACTDELCDGYAPASKGPATCRIDLKDTNASFVRSGIFYTRVLEDGQSFKLYAKTKSGETTSAVSSVIDAAPVDVSVSLNVGSDNRVHVSASVKNVVQNIGIKVHSTNPLPNVTATNECKSDSEILQKNGDDNYLGTCPFKDQLSIVVTAQGIGNKVNKTYKINIEDPKKVELKDFSDHKCKGGDSFGWPDCEGTLSLTAHVSAAAYTIKDQDGNVADSGDTYAGLGEVKLYSNADKNDPIQSKSVDNNGYATFKNVSRNHDHYIWHAKVDGVESNTTEKIDGLEPYKASFEMDSWYNDGYALDHCSQGGNFLKDGVTWKGKNIDHIEVKCHDHVDYQVPMDGSEDSNSCVGFEQSIKSSYDSQRGKIWVDFNIPQKRAGWKNTCACDFTATAYDNSKLHWNNVSWENECVVHGI